jgi:hypothetical protein
MIWFSRGCVSYLLQDVTMPTAIEGVVYGQLQSERFYSGNIGAAVSIPSVGTTTRIETRADGPTRTFTYASYGLSNATDFKNVSASQGYDSASRCEFCSSQSEDPPRQAIYLSSIKTAR